MSAEPSGRADKLGNEYERLWGVLQLLQVVGGEATSVLPEGLGPDEKGVDVWVRRTDGKRVGYQCKRENGTKGKWSIAELQRERILANAKFQLDRANEYRFAFVSSDPAPILSDLCERTKGCNNDPAIYAKYSVTTSGDHSGAFKQVSEYLGFDPEKPHDHARIFDFLSRTEIVRFDRGTSARKGVRAWARLTVEGDPRTIVSELGDYLINNIGNELYGDRIRKFLRERGFQPRNLSGDPELLSSIERLKNRFRRSFLLVGDQVISRTETMRLLNHLNSDESPRILCIHGRAGDGKSGVLYELTDKFDSAGTPFLPLRLDSLKPSKTPEYFGKDVCSLPSSPAACLKAIAGERKAVLILDQLDAIRWTGAHASDAWDVCEELIEEALAYQNLSVIVACRTFDLDDDPHIKRWKSQKKVTPIEIGELPEDEVRKVVSEHGQDWNSLDSRQKKLLRSPQCLYLWTILQNSGKPFSFHTATDLMRAYWEDIRKNRIPTLSVSVEDCNAVLEAVVSYMDDQGKLTAPTSLGSGLPKARDALVSLNVLGVEETGIMFRHQSYLDFLIAEKIIRGILSGNRRIIDWLLDTNQSLFRRDQLRQILALLREQEGAIYEKAIREIIEHDDIRFHLKHLVLTLLGHCDPPTDAESDFIFELLELPEWHKHVVDQVLWNKPAWFEVMDRRGIIEKWLGSENEEEIALAINMMQVISPKQGQRIANRLLKFERALSPWPERLASLFRFSNPAKESRSLFALRLRLMRRGQNIHSSVDWKKLSQDDPKRCIVLFKVSVMQLIDSYRDLQFPISGDKLPSSSAFRWPDVHHVVSASEKVPLYSWKGFIHCMTNRRDLITSVIKRFHPYDDVETARLENKFRLPAILLASAEIAGVAGKVVATMQPGEFFDKLKVTFDFLPKDFQRASIRAMTGAPDDWSDVAIAWLCDHPACFELGRGREPSRWVPASKVIERFSPFCSEQAFQRLEETILAYRSPNLRSSFEWQSESLQKNRIVGNDFGRVQYALLQAIPKMRLLSKARSLLRQWDRKFQLFPLYSGPRSQGGWVTSPIPREVLYRVTDKQWLEIIKKDWSKRGMRWKSMGTDHVGEASHEQFARDMREMARWQPQRFAELAQRIPKEAYPGYHDAVVSALDLTEPPKPQSESGKPSTWQPTLAESWQPATSHQMEAVLDYVGFSNDQDQAISYCRLIERRADANWSPSALKRLIQYATEHSNPAVANLSLNKTVTNREAGTNILTSAINCVRGCAAEAIHRLLFQRPELFSTFLPAIQHLVQDASPAVRVAAIGLCLPVLNIDRGMAVDLFVRACEIDDDRIFEARYANDFVAYARHSHLRRLKSIIERMMKSDNQKVASCGAAWATGTWLQTGRLESWMSACKSGTVPQKKGVADVASKWISEEEDEDFTQKCVTLLMGLFNDDSSEVRDKAASVFYREDIFNRTEMITLTQRFVDTRAFDDDPSRLFLGLESYRGNLRSYAETLLKACRKLSGPLAEASKDFSINIAGCTMELSSLLLRLYERSQDSEDGELQTQCLDAWDMIIRSRTGGLYGVLEKIDS